MKLRKVLALKEVANDLEEGRLFYDRKEQGVGDYFFDSLISDLESLDNGSGLPLALIHSFLYRPLC